MSLRADAAALHPELVALRRDLHRKPEVGLDLPRTQETVLGALDGLGLEISLGRSLSSVTAVLRGGGGPGGTVLLRGDMDALPVTEASGEEFSSRIEGAMHACGHDLHTAGLVGAARLLAAQRDRLTGDVVFMFQPGEEGWNGAGYMLEEGVLTAAGREVDAAYGLHVSSSQFARGTFTCRPGPLMAASDAVKVRVAGAGGHGSAPERSRDPIPAACEMVSTLQTRMTRGLGAFEPAVLTVGSFHAGTKRNIIPDDAVFEATVRSFDPEVRERIRAEVIRVCEGIAMAHGVEVEISYEAEYPVTVNHDDGHEFVVDTVREVFGEERFSLLPTPMTGSEDFSRVLAKVPGAFVFLGAAKGDDPATAPDNHSPRAAFDDAILADGAALLAELASRRLALLAA
ncbi:M20 metallopeptidase family protein [Amycolatopsis jejuensis]|uniref:M20 metallopeptidase family protein n=1 Tax=Amycolatopsis jejuensis TaxID=330084 RepID=UPI00052638DE|nr:M20 family metallopeptidase [Amycolatopsis jejuensis]